MKIDHITTDYHAWREHRELHELKYGSIYYYSHVLRKFPFFMTNPVTVINGHTIMSRTQQLATRFNMDPELDIEIQIQLLDRGLYLSRDIGEEIDHLFARTPDYTHALYGIYCVSFLDPASFEPQTGFRIRYASFKTSILTLS